MVTPKLFELVILENNMFLLLNSFFTGNHLPPPIFLYIEINKIGKGKRRRGEGEGDERGRIQGYRGRVRIIEKKIV